MIVKKWNRKPRRKKLSAKKQHQPLPRSELAVITRQNKRDRRILAAAETEKEEASEDEKRA